MPGKGIHKNVRTLGWISFFTDASSEMIYPIIPFFLTVTLGAPAAALGLMEGAAEALSALVKGLSGPVSDRIRRRKPFIFSGYALSGSAKLIFALSPVWFIAAFSRLLERAGKGIRTPARDALIADVTAAHSRGRAFGFHRAMDTWGAVAGAGLAFLFLNIFKNDFKLVILLSLIPAFFAVLLTIRIAEEARPAVSTGKSIIKNLITPLPQADYRRFVGIYAVFSLGSSSATFMILKSGHSGMTYTGALLPYICANITYALLSERMGELSDRLGRKTVLLGGMLVFAISYFLIFLSASSTVLYTAFILYGIYLAATEGIGKALVTDLVDKREFGRALGFFHFVTGVCALAASLIAGLLWDLISPRAPFLQGAFFGTSAAALLAISMSARKQFAKKS